VADMWATNGAGSTSANQFELCLLVDGLRADPYCYGYQGNYTIGWYLGHGDEFAEYERIGERHSHCAGALLVEEWGYPPLQLLPVQQLGFEEDARDPSTPLSSAYSDEDFAQGVRSMKAVLAGGCTALQFGGWFAAPPRLKPQTRSSFRFAQG